MGNSDFELGSRALVQSLEKRYKEWEGVKQFGGTPERLARMYEDFCWPLDKINQEVEKAFKAIYKHRYEEMLVVKPLSVWTLCPHHLLPCHFSVIIGYIPKEGRVLGLSKFARVADAYARRPIMQEEYSSVLADSLMTNLDPEGVAVYVIGSHGCMTARGVKQHSDIVTSCIRGVYETQPETRAEFFAICRSGNS